MIVDAHAHLGCDEVFDEDFGEEDLLASQAQNGIALTLVQPGSVHDLAGVQRQHDAIAALCARYPGRFRGIANPNPYLPEAAYLGEVRRCVQELGFVGVKINPLAHAVNPLGRHARRVFSAADELGQPVVVHTGAGLPWGAPSLLAPVAEAHPALKLVVAHAGGMLSAEAGLLAERHDNVYLETSWMGGFCIREWVHRLGARRVLFGSDHVDNAATELAKFRSLGLSDEDLQWALGRTATVVFGLEP
ncbi:MAG: amidohydrolase family protein [Gemmatimonadales bacterium]|nr:amidohydrolase family protein [Gemmatimonadales bacterium]